jgi:hypothetical protein
MATNILRRRFTLILGAIVATALGLTAAATGGSDQANATTLPPCSNTFCQDPFSCASCDYFPDWQCRCESPNWCLVDQCGGGKT